MQIDIGEYVIDVTTRSEETQWKHIFVVNNGDGQEFRGYIMSEIPPKGVHLILSSAADDSALEVKAFEDHVMLRAENPFQPDEPLVVKCLLNKTEEAKCPCERLAKYKPKTCLVLMHGGPAGFRIKFTDRAIDFTVRRTVMELIEFTFSPGRDPEVRESELMQVKRELDTDAFWPSLDMVGLYAKSSGVRVQTNQCLWFVWGTTASINPWVTFEWLSAAPLAWLSYNEYAQPGLINHPSFRAPDVDRVQIGRIQVHDERHMYQLPRDDEGQIVYLHPRRAVAQMKALDRKGIPFRFQHAAHCGEQYLRINV